MNGPLRKGKDKSNNLLSGSQQKYKNKSRNPFKGPYKEEAFAISLAILIALLVLLVTHVSTGSNEQIQQANQSVNQTTEIPTKIYSAGGISLQYPSSWNITTDEINETNTQIVIQDPTSANNPQSTQIAAFTIFKVQNDGSETLEQRKDSFIQSFTNSGANIALTNTSNVTVSGINATESVYAGNDPKYNKIQLKVIYLEQNGIFYILGFFTKGMDLQSQDPYFSIILNSFKIQ
ncbi:PsbP-related protein [Methanobacterium sp. MBAC-LM]|uniref:PsbP-related protein n=1 Tax=Methanobacterium sp. MBAC-LM TaxID=3412034 RepID=UPI003C78964A